MEKKIISNKIIVYLSAFLLIVGFLLISSSCGTHKIKKISKTEEDTYSILNAQNYVHHDSDLRKFPYPYKAMLAICSDIDNTTLKKFEEYHRFLNTYSNTIYGTGLGLDIADSFWVYLGKKNAEKDDLMTMCFGVDYNKFNNLKEIKHYYDKGWIDSIHTFGDFSEKNNDLYIKPTRNLDLEAWNILNKYNIKPSIWINHGNEKNVQNFGGYDFFRITRFQQGDNPNSDCYHTDITIKNGIKYVWNSLEGDKFGMNNPLYKLKLRDGQTVWGFKRYTSKETSKGLIWVWEPHSIAEEITKKDLDELVQKNQYSIVTTHFGKGSINIEGVKALRTLAEYQNDHKILIARTSRLLNYCLAQNYIKYTSTYYKGKRYINIGYIDDPIFGKIKPTVAELSGITFYTKKARDTIIMVDDKPVSTNDIDYNINNTQTIGIKWFPKDTTDYSRAY